MNDPHATPSDDSSPTVQFFWRPGCGFCMALEADLTRRGIELEKRNIWDDPEAAAFVRSVAGGNETVPTVVASGNAMVNPSGEQVAATLGSSA